MLAIHSFIQIAPYQHVVVVMSIVLGLSLTQLLKGIAQLYRARSRVRPYWLHSAWVGLLVVFGLLLWWTYWNYRDVGEWTFFRFVLYLSPMIVFYFLTAIVIPDPSDPVTNLRDYYFASRVGFFGVFALYGVVASLTAVLVRGLPLLDISNFFRLAMVLLLLLAMRSASERIHGVVLVLGGILMLVFIFRIQLSLG
jgi:hypothetical protein